MFLAFCAFIAFLLYYFRHHYRAKFVNGLPQLPSLPVIGNSLEVIKSPKNFILKYGRKYPEGFIGNFLGQQSHYLHGNEGNQWIFQGENKYLTNTWPDHWKRMLGPNSLVIAPPQVHKSQRQQLLSVFTPKALMFYLEHINNITRLHLTKLASQTQGEKDIYMLSEIGQCMFDISMKIFLNFEPGSSTGKEIFSQFIIWGKGLGALFPYDIPITVFGKAMSARRKILSITNKILQEKKAQLSTSEDDTEKKFDFLETLLKVKDEEGRMLSDAEILDQVLLFLFASHDSVTSTSCSMVSILGARPDICEKLRKEIDETFEKGEELSYRKIQSMVYLDAFIKETLRVYAPVPGARKKLVQDTPYKDTTIPKNSVAVYSIYYQHFSDDYTNPTEFIPERFLGPDSEEKKHKYMFLTFGHGPRMCLGFNLAKLNMKTLLINLLRDFDFELISQKNQNFPFLRTIPTIRISKQKLK